MCGHLTLGPSFAICSEEAGLWYWILIQTVTHPIASRAQLTVMLFYPVWIVSNKHQAFPVNFENFRIVTQPLAPAVPRELIVFQTITLHTIDGPFVWIALQAFPVACPHQGVMGELKRGVRYYVWRDQDRSIQIIWKQEISYWCCHVMWAVHYWGVAAGTAAATAACWEN